MHTMVRYNREVTEQHNDIGAHAQIYPPLTKETTQLVYNSNENRIMQIETKMVQLESELISVKKRSSWS